MRHVAGTPTSRVQALWVGVDGPCFLRRALRNWGNSVCVRVLFEGEIVTGDRARVGSVCGVSRKTGTGGGGCTTLPSYAATRLCIAVQAIPAIFHNVKGSVQLLCPVESFPTPLHLITA